MGVTSRVAILGTGNVGVCHAAMLGLQGVDVSVGELPSFQESIEPIRQAGGIHLRGEYGEHFVELPVVTTDIEEAIAGCQIIFFCCPAFGQEEFARQCSPFLVDGQVLVFISHFGAIRMSNVLTELNVCADITVGETMSCVYLSNRTGPTEALVRGKKEGLPYAAFPSTATHPSLQVLQRAFPDWIAARNCLETTINNASQWEHPGGTLLNAGWIEATAGGFSFGAEGRTPAVRRIQEAMDGEKMLIAEAVGIEVVSSRDLLKRLYVRGTNQEKYKELKNAPPSLKHRYITEDLCYGVIPIAMIGHKLGVETPIIDAVVDVAAAASGEDLRARALDVADLGLEDISADEIRRIVESGGL